MLENSKFLIKQIQNDIQILKIDLEQIELRIKRLLLELEKEEWDEQDKVMSIQNTSQFIQDNISNNSDKVLPLETNINQTKNDKLQVSETEKVEKHYEEEKAVPFENWVLEKLEHVSINSCFRWLETRNIIIQNYHQEERTDEYFDSVSIFIGDRFQYLKRFLEFFRRSLSQKTPINFDLADAPQEQIYACTQLCTRLEENALISNYRYIKTRKRITAVPIFEPVLINFINGNWLERYVQQIVSKQLTKSALPFASIRNVQIKHSSGRDFEIDVFFLIVDEPLWLECKTGDIERSIQRFSQLKKLLQVTDDQFLMVLSELGNYNQENLYNTWNIKVTDVLSFAEITQKFIDNKLEQVKIKLQNH